MDAAAARLVTLAQASKAIGRQRSYFTQRKPDWVGHAELPFPQPKAHVAGVDVYDLHELLIWNEKRIQRDAATRGRWERPKRDDEGDDER